MSGKNDFIYGFVDDEGNHYNILMSGHFGQPIRLIEDLGELEPASVQCFKDREQAEWYLHSARDRNLALAEQFDRLMVDAISQEYMNSGNYELKLVVCD